MQLRNRSYNDSSSSSSPSQKIEQSQDDQRTQFNNTVKELIRKVICEKGTDLSSKLIRILRVKDLYKFFNEHHDYISSRQNTSFNQVITMANIKSIELAEDMQGILQQIKTKRETRSQTKLHNDITISINETMLELQKWRERFA